MTICERVRELDRLYLKHEALLSLLDAATGERRKRIRCRVNAAWKGYAALRDSRKGLPVGFKRMVKR